MLQNRLHCNRFLLYCVLAYCGASSFAQAAGPAKLELQKGDHICLVGNGLAERIQHDGWLETLIHQRFPQHELVFRNLGYSGDELPGFTESPDSNFRMRSMDCGSSDQWLLGAAPIPQPKKLEAEAPVKQNRFENANTKADVIFAFFGYNESFAGEAGLPNFKKNLERVVAHWRSQKYNGKSAPRIVLFSPIAHEDLKDRNLSDGSENNARLKMYTAAMAEVANQLEVPFVDLLTPSLTAFAAGGPYTLDGIQITDKGGEVVGRTAVQALFPAVAPATVNLDVLRKTVNDKNFYWYHRYRTTDGYSTYGDRAFLKFVKGQTNYEVLQRELDILDLSTEAHEKVVWAAAQGKTLAVDKSKFGDAIPVTTNKPGPLAGKHEFLTGQGAIDKMTVHKDMKVELFASEEKFPELTNLVQMAFDPAGRLWVAAWPSYPHWNPGETMSDKLLILEDTDHDGKADVCKTFAGDLHNPTGFEFWGGGVIVAQGPDILFLKDTNGDDKYDVKERIIHGLDTADTHHTANSFTLDPGGALYFQEGTFHHSQIETPWGAPRRVANGAVFRYEPRAKKTDVYVTYGFANPHGHVWDHWGQDIVWDGTGAVPYHGALFSSKLAYPNKHGGCPTVYQQRTRPCSATEFLSSSHFPEEMRDKLLVCNVIGFQGILAYTPHEQDSSLGATEIEPIVYSADVNFRPADLETAPDGSLYFTDWHNPIIGHMQHNLRDPTRDRVHGRIYRVTANGRPLLQPQPIAGQPIEKLVALLAERDDRVRYRAKIELSGRASDAVLTAVNAWLAALDRKDPEFEHHRLEALWMHQHHNVINIPLLEQVLASPESRARAAAVKMLAYWHDRVPQTLEMLKTAAADPAPRVRLEAIRSASFVPQAEAVEVLLVAEEQPLDKFQAYLHKETMRTLQPMVDQATKDKRKLAFTTPAGAKYYLRNLSTEQLLSEQKDRLVWFELMFRPGLQDAQRRMAIDGLAAIEKVSPLKVVMDAIRRLDASATGADVSVIYDVVRQLTVRGTGELTPLREELEKLALNAKQSLFRQIGFVSLINIDGKVDAAWQHATTSVRSLEDIVNATPLIADANLRGSLYDRIEPLLKALPEKLNTPQNKGTSGRYVRVELPRKGTLTLAEVEVYSGGENIARRGVASQKNTGAGGDAKRAIDGNKSPVYGDGGQTHTEEETSNPYWEVDLGEERLIDTIAIYNRADGLEARLEGFTLKILNAQRDVVFVKEQNPAPKHHSEFTLGGGTELTIRRAAMRALTTVRGQEVKTFEKLASFVADDVERIHAVRALQKLPVSAWSKDQAPALIATLLDSVRKVPKADRTNPAALDQLQFADTLASLLPIDQARKIRAELEEIGVRVIRIGTLLERMSYDQETVVVKAGKQVEFLLENSDFMPHNFVIVRPGALQEIGEYSEAHKTEPDFAAKQFVPPSDKVLAASKLMQQRETQRVSFNVPKEPGVYPFVCTYPGHWTRMYGALYVVPDLEEYQANPETYLAAQKIVAVDPMLKERRPRTEWKLDDLATLVAGFAADPPHVAADHSEHSKRSFGNGKQMFQVASCVACHKLDGVGNVFGPELTKLDPKWKSTDVLKEILEPSARINEKFQTQIFQVDGQTITGLVVEETPEMVKIIENPLLKAEPRILKVSEIEARKKSLVSLMPKGLVDKLTRDEILDLMTFVAAAGDKNHPLYQGHSEKTGGHHHGK